MKNKCRQCEEPRAILDQYNLCVFCDAANKKIGKDIGNEVFETTIAGKIGTEIKSKTGKMDENVWMQKQKIFKE